MDTLTRKKDFISTFGEPLKILIILLQVIEEKCTIGLKQCE